MSTLPLLALLSRLSSLSSPLSALFPRRLALALSGEEAAADEAAVAEWPASRARAEAVHDAPPTPSEVARGRGRRVGARADSFPPPAAMSAREQAAYALVSAARGEDLDGEATVDFLLSMSPSDAREYVSDWLGSAAAGAVEGALAGARTEAERGLT